MVTIKVSEDLYTYFEQVGNRMHVPSGKSIYMQGDQAANRLYLITRGRVRVYCISNDGKELTLEIVEKGRIFGEYSFSHQAVRQTNVDAVNDVEIISFSLEEIYPYLSQSKEITLILFQLLSDTCNHLHRQLKRFSFYDRYQRVASFLLDETAFPSKEKDITDSCIPYSHEELAVCLGMNRVTITKVLNEFKRRGWIDLGHKKVIISDRAALSEFFSR